MRRQTIWERYESSEALLRMLVTALLKNEKIETTVAKAKEIRPLAEKMISLASVASARSTSGS